MIILLRLILNIVVMIIVIIKDNKKFTDNDNNINSGSKERLRSKCQEKSRKEGLRSIRSTSKRPARPASEGQRGLPFAN